MVEPRRCRVSASHSRWVTLPTRRDGL
jgi:hypothetical protein